MPDNKAMNAVLDRIDADLDKSLERLFALLRIKSISADPAFAADCKLAADHLAKDLTSLGFAGFVSKDAIIEAAFASHRYGAMYGFLCTDIAAGLTAENVEAL